MTKKIHACPSINKSTERRPRVPHHQSAILSTVAADLSPQAVLGLHRKLRSAFFRSESLRTNRIPRLSLLCPSFSLKGKRAWERGCLRTLIVVFFVYMFIPASLAMFWPRSVAESFLPECMSCVAKLCAMAWASVARPSDQFRKGEWCRVRYLLWACSAWWGCAAIFGVTELRALNCNQKHIT